MVRRKLTKQLEVIKDYLWDMKECVLKIIENSLIALESRDKNLAKKIINEDEKMIDDYQYDIEDLCGRIIATEHPVATELREILAIIKIISSLERIADHSTKIVKVVLLLESNEGDFSSVDIYQKPLREMADTAKDMLANIFDAYFDGDFIKILKIVKYDNIIDKLFSKQRTVVIDAMKNNPENLDYLLNILFLNSFLERVGDHVATIGELLYFVKVGEKVNLT
ncbi:Phosphate transport system protein phoU -like protein [Borrelia nietonii YOR]|uniref:Phosphate-specific transport system accessory protein PhoU n=1 Tax=Borrelia nietonii YOR TaxID=1293576 RepID=A0ABN4C6Z1_9SPIR|nr:MULTISPECIES: phosphate signaling complex protein PhoU [Borrelia]AHH02992.1 Phosphate transport system protein phoU -like protein [Borrelia nietonii YOR]AHH13545.1 Phosphate transport system protein phoU -like protein [Borrelia hermsii MTW]UPA08786.1 phosphate signaling complex protein PhoU [Borrelia nietonii YOR]